MSYTLSNLRDVPDVAPGAGFDDVMEARFAGTALDAEQTGLAFQRFKPGQRGGAHRHEQAEEIYVVVGGAGQASLDGEIVELAPLDALRIAPQVARAFAGGPDGLELIVFGPRHQGDGELLDEDPWTS